MVRKFWRWSQKKQSRATRLEHRRAVQPTVEILEHRWLPSGVTFNEGVVPTAKAFPYGIVFGPDGNMWFTESQKGKIGVNTLAGTVIHEYPIPSLGGFPDDIIVGPDKNLWFTEVNAGVIGTITTGGIVTEYSIPTALSGPRALTVGPDGAIWFAESNSHKLGRITTSGVVSDFVISSGNNPFGITVGPDGRLWYTAPGAGNVGQVTLNSNGTISTTEFNVGAFDPQNIVAGPDGALWFTEFQAGRIGRMTTDGATKNNFPLPNIQCEPSEIVSNTDGTLWFTEYNGNKIGQFFATAAHGIPGTINEYPVPTANSFPLGIALDVNKNVWFTENTGNNICVAVLPPTHVGVGVPANSTAGTPFTVVVSALNDAGGVAAGYLGKVHLTSTDPKGVLPADYQFTAADFSTHTFTNAATFKTAGSETVTAADVANTITSGSGTVAVGPATPSQLGAKFAVNTASAGAAVNFTVSALDDFGNVSPTYLGTVHIGSSDAQASLPADYQFVSGDNGVHTFTITLRTAGTPVVTATDTSTGTMTATASITITPAALDHLGIVVPGPVVAGTAFTPTIAAVDPFNNVIVAYQGTISFSSTDPQATLPGNYLFLAADKGTHAFISGATLITSGNISLNVQDVKTPALTGTLIVQVAPAPAAQIKVVASPPTVTAGNVFTVTVTMQDQFFNTATNYTGTVFFKSSDSAGTPPGAYAFLPTDKGVHIFSAILRTAGAQTITSTDTVNGTVGGSGPVTVKPASFDHLALGAPANTVAGTANTVTVTTVDTFGNQTTGYSGTVHFTSTDAAATLPANFKFLAGNTGQQVFANAVTFRTAGSRTLTVKDIAVAFFNAQAAVNVNPAAANHLSVTLPASATAGAAVDATITALDPFNNQATSYAGTVQFSSSDTKASLPANFTFGGADSGRHVFSAVVAFRRAGSQTLFATDTGNGATNGSTNLTVNAGPTATFLLAGFPSPAAAGTTGSFTATASDAFGNITAGYTGVLHFSSSDKQAALPADYTFTSTDAGVHAFAATLKTSGSQTIAASDSVKPATTGSVAITIDPGPMTGILVFGFPTTVVIGTPAPFTVASVDAFNNPTSGYLGTVHFSSSDGAAALPNDYTFKPADQGQQTFSATLNTLGSQSITAADINATSLNSTEKNIAVTNPLPTATSLSVSTAVEGGSAQTILISGTNFISASGVLLNGKAVQTTLISATSLQAVVPATALAEEGALTLAVSNPAPGGGMSAALPFTVSDAAIHATASAPSLVEGNTFSGEIATFTDDNTGAAARDFTASIVWGDGHVSKGKVVSSGAGFSVQGANTYANVGSYSITVSILDVGGASAAVSAKAAVADAPLSATALAMTQSQFVTLSRVPLATFTDGAGPQHTTNYVATIDWGDKTPPTLGVVSQVGDAFRVDGAHSYTTAGAFTIAVTIQDAGGQTASASTSVQIGDDVVFIAGQYHDLLGRVPDPTGYNGFKQFFDNQRSAAVQGVALAYVTSAEARARLINGFYTTLLGRNAGADELNAGLQQLQSKAAPESIAASLAASNEYFQRGGSGTNAWLDQAYADILGRSRNGQGQGFLNALNTGTTRAAVAGILLNSPEYRARLITETYLTYLGRTPTPGELGNGQAVLATQGPAGGAVSPHEQFVAGILSTAEYFQANGDTNQSWVNSLYTKFLSRQPDQTGRDAAVNAVVDRETGIRQGIAASFATSREYRMRLVQGYYNRFLHRTASTGEALGWVNVLASGVSDEQLIAAFVSSNEYFQRAGHTISAWLDQVYLDVLGRARNAGETGFQHALIQGSLTPGETALAIATSTEYRGDLVAAYFSSLLGRQPSADESANVLQSLQSGLTDEQLAVSLLATREYALRTHLFP